METTVDRLFSQILRGRDGKNIGLDIGLPKLKKIIAGVQRSMYTVIAGSTGSGKTTFVLYTYIYRQLMSMLGDERLKIIYYSLEMTGETLLAKIASLYMYETFGREVTFNTILSRDGIISDEDYELVMKTREWLELVQKHLIIYDKGLTCNGLYAHLKTYAEANGDFSTTEHQQIYTPYVEDQYTIVVIDHIGLIRKMAGQSKKDAIDMSSNYLIQFRNKCGFSPVVLMQVNRQSSSMDRRKGDMQELQLDDLKDSGTPSEDAEIVMALFNPYREKMSSYRDYKIKIIKEYFRSMVVLKNRYGEADKVVPLNFFGTIGYWRELPKPDEISLEDYERFRTIDGYKDVDANIVVAKVDAVDDDEKKSGMMFTL